VAEPATAVPAPTADPPLAGGPDRRDGRAYVMTSELRLAVKVALATGRPLLLRGDPGSGKSSLAAHIAFERRWRYYEHVVTSRTLTQDLLWSFDPVRRFADASVLVAAGSELDEYRYVTPGVLWWAFDRVSADRRGGGGNTPEAPEPLSEINETRDDTGAVVLIDEIDKADPDMPNGILVPLGSGEFTVTETGTRVRQQGPGGLPRERLIVITTNGERELPQAFLRRCVTAELTAPADTRLVEIATEHLVRYEGSCPAEATELAQALAVELVKLRKTARALGVRAPSTAEYLDALNACRNLNISVGGGDWAQLKELTLLKGEYADPRGSNEPDDELP
jgi:MoxR-like ATPase